MDIDGLLRPPVRGFEPPTYPGPDPGYLRMDANTNLVGRNPAVERAARRLASLDVNQYPSCLSDELRDAIAREHGLAREEVIVGNGSDEVLDTLCKTFVSPGDVVACPTPSFVMYGFFGRLHLGKVVEVACRGPEMEIDVNGLLAARAKLTLVASPNNPTGRAVPARDLEALVRGCAGIVLVDEAYADFCAQDFGRHVRDCENLVVSRTFSKSHGLAGLRVGYGLANRKLMQRLLSAKTPLTLDVFSEAAAIESLADKTFWRESVELIKKERGRAEDALREIGMQPIPTHANFLLIDVGRPSGSARAFLKSKGILTREMGDFKGLGNCIRATVGRPEHTDRLVAALKEWKASCSP